MFNKNNSFLARLSIISANFSENYRRYNFQAFANILKYLFLHYLQTNYGDSDASMVKITQNNKLYAEHTTGV